MALIIGSLVGMERETGKALSGNVGIGVGAVSASVSQALGECLDFLDHDCGNGRAQCYSRSGQAEAHFRARRTGAVAQEEAYLGAKAVTDQKAKGRLGRPVSHPDHGDTPE